MIVDTNHQIDRNCIETLLVAATPERQNDIQGLWKRFNPEFWLKPDSKGIQLLSTGNQIHFSEKTLAAVWILGFVSWKIFTCYRTKFVLNLHYGKELDFRMFQTDKFRYERTQVIKEILSTVQKIINASFLCDVSWPPEVPYRQADKTGFDLEQQATFDITIFATAYLLLHELKHVIFNKQGNTRPEPPEEENACDAFARNFLLDTVDKYAEIHGACYEKVLTKRAMGVALGAFIVFEMTPRCGRLGNANYPPICDRLECLMTTSEIDSNSYFWIWVGTLLLSILFRFDHDPEIPTKAPDELCRHLIERIRAAVRVGSLSH